MMSESSKRHSKFLSLIFILKCLSKASVIRILGPSEKVFINSQQRMKDTASATKKSITAVKFGEELDRGPHSKGII